MGDENRHIFLTGDQLAPVAIGELVGRLPTGLMDLIDQALRLHLAL